MGVVWRETAFAGLDWCSTYHALGHDPADAKRINDVLAYAEDKGLTVAEVVGLLGEVERVEGDGAGEG